MLTSDTKYAFISKHEQLELTNTKSDDHFYKCIREREETRHKNMQVIDIITNTENKKAKLNAKQLSDWYEQVKNPRTKNIKFQEISESKNVEYIKN